MLDRHIIKQQILDSRLYSEESAFDTQNRLSTLCSSKIPGILDEICCDLIDTGTHVVLDSLEIDIGTISAEHLETEFPAKVRERFSQKLKSVLHDINSVSESRLPLRKLDHLTPLESVTVGSGKDNSAEGEANKAISNTESSLELIRTFLVAGTFPWWAEKIPYQQLEHIFDELIDDIPVNVISMLSPIIGRMESRHRLIYQFSEEILWRITKLIMAEEIAGFMDLRHDLEAVMRNVKGVQIIQNELRIHFWNAVLAVSSMPIKSTERKDHFLNHYTTRIAEKNSISLGTLFQSLRHSIKDLAKAKFSFQSDFPQLVETVLNGKNNWAEKGDSAIDSRSGIASSKRSNAETEIEAARSKYDQDKQQAETLSSHASDSNKFRREDVHFKESQRSNKPQVTDPGNERTFQKKDEKAEGNPASQSEVTGNDSQEVGKGSGTKDIPDDEFTESDGIPKKGNEEDLYTPKQSIEGEHIKRSGESSPASLENKSDQQEIKEDKGQRMRILEIDSLNSHEHSGSKSDRNFESVEAKKESRKKSTETPKHADPGSGTYIADAASAEGTEKAKIRIGSESFSAADGGADVRSLNHQKSRNHERSTQPPATNEADRTLFPESADGTEEQYADVEQVYVENAGMILLWPYLTRFFNHCELLKDNQFIEENAQIKAVHLLQYIITETEDTPEYILPLNKLLCGYHLSKPLLRSVALDTEHKAEGENLIQSVITHWPALKNTSVNGFRTSFLQRNGALEKQEKNWLLRVERKAFDMILEQLPWGISTIKLPWMKTLLYVEW